MTGNSTTYSLAQTVERCCRRISFKVNYFDCLFNLIAIDITDKYWIVINMKYCQIILFSYYLNI